MSRRIRVSSAEGPRTPLVGTAEEIEARGRVLGDVAAAYAARMESAVSRLTDEQARMIARGYVRPFVEYASSSEPVWTHEAVSVLDDALGKVAEVVARASEVEALRRERDELVDGIRRHQRAKTPKSEEARRFYGPPSITDSTLWALLATPTGDEQ